MATIYNLGGDVLYDDPARSERELVQCVVAQGKSLAHARLTRVDLRCVDFGSTDLRNADFFGSDMTCCRFAGAKMERVSFGSAILRDSNWQNCLVSMADFNAAAMSNAVLHECDLSLATFSGTDLSNASLQGCDMTGSYLWGPIALAGCKLPCGTIWEEYVRESVPELLTSTGMKVEEFEESWDYHDWNLCPVSKLYGVRVPQEIPKEQYEKAMQFLLFFDADLIPFPSHKLPLRRRVRRFWRNFYLDTLRKVYVRLTRGFK